MNIVTSIYFRANRFIEIMFIEAYNSSYGFKDLIDFMYAQDFICKGSVLTHFRPNLSVSNSDFLFVKA